MLKWIAYGPKDDSVSYKGYIINEQRFHVKDLGRQTQNCGVSFDAITIEQVQKISPKWLMWSLIIEY